MLYNINTCTKLLNCYVSYYKRVLMDISQSLYNISENDDNFLDLILEMDVLTEELLTPRGFEANIFIRPLL